ncbi:MAG: ABC transporter substrate-binding protein [Spirochaetales bacterium]|nr:ABC transporter substrate-binding protein [Spirochaetales bacterium]
MMILVVLTPSGCLRQRGTTGEARIEGDGYPLSVVDDYGNTFAVREKPRRIISGALFIDELLLSIVQKGDIAAVTNFAEDGETSNIEHDLDGIEHRIPFNVEIYLSLKPDIVFLSSWSGFGGAEQLRDAGIPVCILDFPVTFNGVIRTIRFLARLTAEKESGEELIEWMEDKLNQIERLLSPLTEEERLTVMDYSADFGTSFGAGSMWDEIVRHAGLKNAVAALDADRWGAVPISKEALIRLDPDIIILPDWVYGERDGADRNYSLFMEDPAFRVLSAVKNRRVYRIPEKHRSSGSHYSVLGVEDLARRAYPTIFGRENEE